MGIDYSFDSNSLLKPISGELESVLTSQHLDCQLVWFTDKRSKYKTPNVKTLKDKTSKDKTPNVTKCRIEKTPNGTKHRMEKTSNSKKHPMEKTSNWKNAEWDKTSKGTKRRIENMKDKKLRYLCIFCFLFLIRDYIGTVTYWRPIITQRSKWHHPGNPWDSCCWSSPPTRVDKMSMSLSLSVCPWTQTGTWTWTWTRADHVAEVLHQQRRTKDVPVHGQGHIDVDTGRFLS